MLLSGIYDSEFIQPVARVKDNLSIWTQGKYSHYKVEYIEPMPPGPALMVEMVTASGLTTLAAGAAIAKRVVAILQLNENEFLHLRWFPLDNAEGVIWEVSGQQKFASRNVHSRVDPRIREWDPTLATTTFFILGENHDMNLEVRNPMGYATPLARFQFFGNKSILNPYDLNALAANYVAKLAQENTGNTSYRPPSASDIAGKLREGDEETVRRIIGQTTWLPAEGRAA